MKNVPENVRIGCNMAETGLHDTGWNDYDDFDHPLRPFDIIPEGSDVTLDEVREQCNVDGEEFFDTHYVLPAEFTKPSSVRDESLVTIIVPNGMHPFDFLKQSGVSIEKAWIFMDEDCVEAMRRLPNKFHQATVAYGEFFRFEDNDTISLQAVKYFLTWKIALNCEVEGKTFERPESPECIIQMEMQK